MHFMGYGVWDGSSIAVDEPLPLEPGTRVVITVRVNDSPGAEEPRDEAGGVDDELAPEPKPVSWLATARELKLQGPKDLSVRRYDHP